MVRSPGPAFRLPLYADVFASIVWENAAPICINLWCGGSDTAGVQESHVRCRACLTSCVSYMLAIC